MHATCSFEFGEALCKIAGQANAPAVPTDACFKNRRRELALLRLDREDVDGLLMFVSGGMGLNAGRSCSPKVFVR